MRPPKYPLEPLVEVRLKKVDEGVAHLAAARRERDAAERGRLASEHRRLVHASAAEHVRVAERDALVRGELRVSDLARCDAWEVRIAAEQCELASEVDRARAEEDRARTGENRACDQAALLEAEAQVVVKGRARWSEERRKHAEAREEDSSAEAWRRPKP